MLVQCNFDTNHVKKKSWRKERSFENLVKIPLVLLLFSTIINISQGFGISSVQKSVMSGSSTKSFTPGGSGGKESGKEGGSGSGSNGGKESTAKSPLVPVLNLKRKPNDPKDYDRKKAQNAESKVVVEELECTQSMFMSPFHHPVPFALNESIYKRIDKSCRWSFIGTEPCIPKISCDTSGMKRSCDEEYLEIVDGHMGYMKVCSGSGPKVDGIIAADDLRDLYIHYVVKKPPANPGNEKELLSCTVTCTKRADGTPLERTFTPKSNPRCYCGTKPNEDRIVGGENAKKFEFPWLVALVETNTRQPFCGGSIINNRFILTAGHCIKGKYMDYRNIQIVINGHEFDSSPNQNVQVELPQGRTYSQEELEKMDKGNGSSRYNIDEIIVHPLYVAETNDFDIALLKLQSPVTLTPRAPQAGVSNLQQPRSICLPPMGAYLRTFSNKKAIIAGWGLPDIEAEGTPQVLQKLEVKVFSPKACKDMFAHRVNRRMLCAGHREGGKDACAGDSGGPLVLEDRPKVWVQVGSVSWGEGCGEAEHPGVYFRTTEATQWLSYHSNYYNRGAGGDVTTNDDGEKGATWCITP